MREQVPTLVGDRFDNATFDMWTRIIMVKVDMVLFDRSSCLDCSVNTVKLSQVNIAVDVQLSLIVFVRNSPMLTLIIPPIANPV